MNRIRVLVVTLLLGGLMACEQPTVPPGQSKPTTQPRAPWPFLSEQTTTAARDFDPHAVMKRNYYVVFDASGSMQYKKCSGDDRKIDVAKRALLAFARQLPSDANLGLSVFDERSVRELLQTAPINAADVANVIDPIEPGGDTPLADAISQAYRALTQRAVTQLGYGEYHLVVITDGEASGTDPRGIVDLLTAESPVVLHTMGFCIEGDHSLNQPGRTVYQSADNPEELARGLTDVLAEAPSFTVAKFK